MGNPITEIYERFKERISDTFLSSFIIAFVAVNWDFFYFIIKSDNNNLPKTIESAKSMLQSASILWPLGIAFFYTFVYQIIKILFQIILTWIRNLEIYVQKMQYLNISDRNKLEQDYTNTIGKLKTHILKSYRESLKYVSNKAFTYEIIKNDGDKRINEFYVKQKDAMVRPVKFYREYQLRYVVALIDTEYCICASVGDFVPIPDRLIESQQPIIYFLISGDISVTEPADKNLIVAQIVKIDETKAELKHW